MRPDVKLGVVISMALVLVAGAYFFFQDRQESPIPVGSLPTALADTSGAKNQTAEPPQDKRIPSRRISQPAPNRGSTGLVPRDTVGQPISARRSATGTKQPTSGTEAGERRVNASPRRDRQTSSQRTSDAKRKAQNQVAQGRRSRDQRGTPRRKITAKQKPQRALTATLPAQGNQTASSLQAGTAAAVERHRVVDGDTMSSLAGQYYGSSTYTQFLVGSNPQLANPDRLRIGDIINIPPRPAAKRPTTGSKPKDAATKASSTREYRVKSGDSFYKIARDVLGDATRWRELYELNKRLVDNDPTRLQVNQVIVLPRQ